MKGKTPKMKSVLWMHSERGWYEKGRSHLQLKSANLIDFFLEVFKKTERSVLILPLSRSKGEVSLEIPENTSVYTVPYPESGQGIRKNLWDLFGFLRAVISPLMLAPIRQADITASVGLCFNGTVFAIIRCMVAGRDHNFIVRGNRLETARRTTRNLFSKAFVLARVCVYKWIMNRLISSGRARVWFQGQEEFERFREKHHLKAEDRVFLLNALLRDMDPGKLSQGLKKRWDLVFLGRLTIEKGILDLIEAVSILSGEGFCLSVLIIGDGPDRIRAEEEARRLGLIDRISFVGYESSPERLGLFMRQSRLFVLPSYTEGLPRSMLESMHMGVPVLVTPVGGIKSVSYTHLTLPTN